MNALWIRVDADELNSVRVAELADALGIAPVYVLGHLTALGGAVAKHRPDGRINDVSPRLLERWAAWPGEPGLFASAVTKHLVDQSGQLHEWSDTMGKLIERREKDRQRKARGTSAETPRKEVGIPPLRDETVRDETVRASAPVAPSGATKSGSGKPADASTRSWRSPAGRTAAAAARTAPPAPHPSTPANNGKNNGHRRRTARLALDAAAAACAADAGSTEGDDSSEIVRAAAALPFGAMTWFWAYYGEAAIERQRDVIRQLLACQTPRGARFRGKEYVRNVSPERLESKCREMAEDPPLEDPNKAIFVLFLKITDTSDNSAPGQIAETAAAVDRREESKIGAERLRIATTWLGARPEVADAIERALPVQPGDPSYKLTRNCAIIDAWQRAGSPGTASS